MTDARYDLVIVGLGSGGLPAAELAARLPIRVAVVERGRVGGDCLWTGCVPSKALLASARTAHAMRTADRYGLPAVDPEIDTSLVWGRIRSVQEAIAATDDSPERVRSLGLDLYEGSATLADPHTVVVDGRMTLRTRFVLLATGSRPASPLGPGHLTSETVFELDRAPSSLTVVGGGPIGVELAQAFARLGTRTTLLHRGDRLLPRDEPSLVDRLTDVLRSEGVDVRLGAPATPPFGTDAVLVAAGREPNVEGLGLEALGIAVGDDGVVVDDRGRTAVPSVYAVGDVVGRHRFTHAAAQEGVAAVRDMFFPGRGRPAALVPWCTFTDPELAHVGLTSAEAGGGAEVHEWPLTRSDRARADGRDEGAVVAVTRKGVLVGAHVLGPAAGEVVHELALAVQHGMRLDQLASLVHVYPTYSTDVGRLAAEAAFARADRYRFLVRLGSLAARLRR